jgi:FkbM family methyltransferase
MITNNSRLLRFAYEKVSRIASHLRYFLAAAKSIGTSNALRLARIRWGSRFPSRAGSKWQIRVRRWPHPVIGRFNTSDLSVFEQIFVREEHRWADALKPCSDMLILDCGANVGYSAIYFLRMFPESTVIAVEPDKENFAILEANLNNSSPNVVTLNAAVWSRNADLNCGNMGFRDGMHWARQVSVPVNGEKGDTTGFTIPHLLQVSGKARISILKIDIEGAEAEVFSTDPGTWLKHVDAVAIELHDDTSFGDARSIVLSSLSQDQFVISRCGELTVAVRTGM